MTLIRLKYVAQTGQNITLIEGYDEPYQRFIFDCWCYFLAWEVYSLKPYHPDDRNDDDDDDDSNDDDDGALLLH